METDISTTPVNTLQTNPSFFSSKKNKLIIIALALIVLTTIGFLTYLKFSSTPKSPLTPPPQTPANKPENIIAKVGAESIYQLDLDIELAYYPKDRRESRKKYLLDKIITDSIILQAGQEEKLIYLDTTTFNSLHKEYLKRIALVEEVKKKITTKEDSVSGTIITMWFVNGPVGPLGYEKSKEIVKAKITKIHSDVVNKRITIQQAAEQIKKDSSLEQIDKAYQVNASFDFKSIKNEPMSIIKELDEALRLLSPGQVSDVFAGKLIDRDSGQEIEVLYAFGQVSEKINNGKVISFDDWLTQQRSKYEIKYY